MSYRLWHYPGPFLVGMYLDRKVIEKVCGDFKYWDGFEKVDEDHWVKRNSDGIIIEQLIIQGGPFDKV